LLLAKPINAQFFVSCQKMSIAYTLNFILSLGWLIWTMGRIEGLSYWNLSVLLICIPCGVAISYSMRFFFSCFSLIFTRAEYIQYLWYQIYRFGTRPHNIYPYWLRYLVISFIPVGFIASVPAQLLLQTARYQFLLLGIFIAVDNATSRQQSICKPHRLIPQ
jgi:ABC-2 type transport system permease protein